MKFNLFHSPEKTITDTNKKYDTVDNPKHYIEGRKFEPAWVINDWKVDWNIGTCIKYLSRLGRKDATNIDIQKAFWYLTHEIALHYKDISKEKLIATIDNIYQKEEYYGKYEKK